MDTPKGKPRGRNGGRKKLDPTGAYRKPRSWSMTDAEFDTVDPLVQRALEQIRKAVQPSEWVES